MPTLQEIQAQQGTRLEKTNPWDSYASEIGSSVSPAMAAAVAEYANKRYVDGPSSSQAQEELAMRKEWNDETAREYQWATPDEYQNVEERTGKVLHSSEFITKLRKHGIKCHYVQHIHDDKAILVVIRNGERENACWVQKGYMPELSILNFDDHGVPLAERRRGWRTCLLQLILKNIITENDAHRVFGKPKLTAAYGRYNSTLQAFRSRTSEVV